jgi:hypothetical protein
MGFHCWPLILSQEGDECKDAENSKGNQVPSNFEGKEMKKGGRSKRPTKGLKSNERVFESSL